MADEVNIAISVKDNYSKVMGDLKKATNAFGTDVAGLQKRLDAINKSKVTLQIDVEQAKKHLKDMKKAFEDNGTDAAREDLRKAQDEYNTLASNLSAVTTQAKDTERAIRSLNATVPQSYINKIESFRGSKTVFRFIISGTEVNLPVRVQSFIFGEQDGTNDVEYSITFAVHRELETVETAGFTLPKRNYDNRPKSKGKSKGKGKGKSKGNSEKPRTNKTPNTTPKTITGSSTMQWSMTTLTQDTE